MSEQQTATRHYTRPRATGCTRLHLADCAASSITWRDALPRPRKGLLMIYDLRRRTESGECRGAGGAQG